MAGLLYPAYQKFYSALSCLERFENPILFDDLVLTEQLFPHLHEVQEIAEKRVEVIMVGLLEKNPAPDKETDSMAWVRHMNMMKAMAEEVVVREVIYI